MATTKEKIAMLTARVPASLIKALDKAAKRARRDRSKELIYRLEESLKASAARAPE